VAKVVVSQLQVAPLVLAFYRCSVSGFLLILGYGVPLAKEMTGCSPGNFASFPRVSGVQTRQFCLLGLLLAGSMGGNIMALQYISAVTEATLCQLCPIIVGILSPIFGTEELSMLKLCSIMCSAIGAGIVVAYGESVHPHGPKTSTALWNGLACMGVNIVCSAGFILLQKKLLHSFPPAFVVALTNLYASPPLFLGALATVGTDHYAWSMGNSPTAMLALLYAIFFVTMLNYSITAWVNKTASPTFVSSFHPLQPILVAIFTWQIYGIAPNKGQIAGAAFIVLGLLSFVGAQSEANPKAELLPLKPEKASYT